MIVDKKLQSSKSEDKDKIKLFEVKCLPYKFTKTPEELKSILSLIENPAVKLAAKKIWELI